MGSIAAIAAVAFVALAIFAWAEKTSVVDPNELSTSYWPWRLWQLGPLVIALAGVWWLWFSTRRVAWVRGLALGVFALAVLANTYSGLFGDYSAEVWQTVNPLFIAFSSVAAVALWRCGCAAGRVGTVIAAALGIVIFINAYFTNNVILWQIMDPLMMLAALAWAAGVLHIEVETSGDG